MRLRVNGEEHDFIPIRDFRAKYDLPEIFGVATFEAKDYVGLGRIDRAGEALNSVRADVLEALPARMTAQGWLAFLPGLTQFFEAKLNVINPHVGLKEVEIGFAVAGFSDVCHALAYALLRARAAGESLPEFRAVYAEWLSNSVRVFSEVHPYTHQGQTWQVRVIAHAYGRAGLLVSAGQSTYYVYDPALACPAEGFMVTLLAEVARRMIAATV